MSDHHARHPRFRALLDRRDGGLSPRRAADVDAHLDAGCATCADAVGAIEELIGDLAAGALPEPPAVAMRAARRLFVHTRARELVERVLAKLVFDERLTPAMALRSAVGSARRALYDAGDVEVYLELSRTAAGWTLMGEFLTADSDDVALDGVVFVRSGARVLARVELSADGTFVVEGLPDTSICVEGRVAGRWIDVPPIATG